MEAHNATTAADSDDDYLDDVVVRAAHERLQREFADTDGTSVIAPRFDFGHNSDYIDIGVQDESPYTLANIVQRAIDTGVVEVVKIQTDEVRFAPTED